MMSMIIRLAARGRVDRPSIGASMSLFYLVLLRQDQGPKDSERRQRFGEDRVEKAKVSHANPT